MRIAFLIPAGLPKAKTSEVAMTSEVFEGAPYMRDRFQLRTIFVAGYAATFQPEPVLECCWRSTKNFVRSMREPTNSNLEQVHSNLLPSRCSKPVELG